MRSFSKLTSGPKKFQKLLWTHRPSKPTIDFPEMLTPMSDSLSPLVRQLVNTLLKITNFTPYRGNRWSLYFCNCISKHLNRHNIFFSVFWNRCTKVQKTSVKKPFFVVCDSISCNKYHAWYMSLKNLVGDRSLKFFKVTKIIFRKGAIHNLRWPKFASFLPPTYWLTYVDIGNTTP